MAEHHKNGGSYTLEELDREALAREAAQKQEQAKAETLAASRDKPAAPKAD